MAVSADASDVFRPTGQPFRRTLRLLRQGWNSLFDPYHPERHYMRGPGPRWYAKHGAAPITLEGQPAVQ